MCSVDQSPLLPSLIVYTYTLKEVQVIQTFVEDIKVF